MGAGNDWLQSAMAFPQAGRDWEEDQARGQSAEGVREKNFGMYCKLKKNKCKINAQKLQIERAITKLTSGPGEKLLKELGDLLEEGEDSLKRLLWARQMNLGGGVEWESQGWEKNERRRYQQRPLARTIHAYPIIRNIPHFSRWFGPWSRTCTEHSTIGVGIDWVLHWHLMGSPATEVGKSNLITYQEEP